MSIFNKLIIKVKSELDIDIINPQRRYVGYWQRSAGAWVWVANMLDDGNVSATDIGSSYSATELLKSKLELYKSSYGWEILPI